MTKRSFVDVGTRFVNKKTGAKGTVVDRFGVSNRPSPYPKTLLAGGDMTGELSWFASFFKVIS